MTDSKTTPDQTDAAQAAASTEAQEAVGQLLRETRQKAGLDIADVARVLRISQKYLEALEDGRNADLPGAAYAIGFVRSYAEHLHLDGEEIVRRYKAQAEGVDAKTNLVFPKPIPDSGVPGAAVLGLGVIVAAVAYGAWYYNSMQADVVADRVEAVPEHLAAAGGAPEAPSMPAPAQVAPSQVPPAQVVEDSMAEAQERTPSVPEPTEPPVEDAAPEPVTPAAEAVQEPADAAQAEAEAAADTAQETMSEAAVPETAATQTEAASEEVVQAAETAAAEAQPASVPDGAETAEPAAEETAAAEQTASAEPAVPADEAAPDGPSRITVRAKSNSWIQVRDETLDRLLFTRLLREGDEYEVPNRPGLHLMTGNAGALELVVDGETIPAIGAVGEVRRDVELDPEKLKAGTAVAE